VTCELECECTGGIDHIPAVLIKAEGRTLHYETNELTNSICDKQELPEQWKESIIVPVYEMGNKTDYRTFKCDILVVFYE
jgi:hypothetical protein